MNDEYEDALHVMAALEGGVNDSLLEAMRDELDAIPTPAWATKSTPWNRDDTCREHLRACGLFEVFAFEEFEIATVRTHPPEIRFAKVDYVESWGDPAVAREFARDLMAAADVLEEALRSATQ